MIFTETWLNGRVPDVAIELEGRTMFRADGTTEDSGKTRGGGLGIYVNNAWCTNAVMTGRLEYLSVKCRPHQQGETHSEECKA